jgi:hypothetical protein
LVNSISGSCQVRKSLWYKCIYMSFAHDNCSCSSQLVFNINMYINDWFFLHIHWYRHWKLGLVGGKVGIE